MQNAASRAVFGAGAPPVFAGVRDDASATVDDHSLAVLTDSAVVREPLHLREVDGAGEEADQGPSRIQDGNCDHHGSDAGITARPHHVRVFRPDAAWVEHFLDVVPDAVVDADAGGRGGGDGVPGQGADVELQEGRVSRVGGGQLHVQGGGVEGCIV